MKPLYHDKCFIKSGDDSEVVNVVEFNYRVNLVIDFRPGTRHYRRITLVYDQSTDDYRTEVYSYIISSRGPKLVSGKKH